MDAPAVIAAPMLKGLELTIVEESTHPVLTKGDPDTEEIKHGFEGGCVIKVGTDYHLFTAEMYDDPLWIKMRLAHWTSRDGVSWKRNRTLYQSSGDPTGVDTRASLWAPMPVFDQSENLWNLFYVAYRAPATARSWDGRIWRAVSRVRGINGISGPWQDVGVVLQRDEESDPWESVQGTDSSFPFRVGDRWLMFFGSSNAKDWWKVGLAEAPALAGPWKRLSGVNPIEMNGAGGTENPIVSQLADGRYLAVFDVVQPPLWAVAGYSVSEDGISWSKVKHLELDPSSATWCRDLRTPLGLISENDGTFTLFFTAYGPFVDGHSFSSLGKVRVTID